MNPVPCPKCSLVQRTPVHLVVPCFFPAPRTSARRGIECRFFTGCEHAEKITGGRILEAPEFPAVIARWNERVAQHIAERTAGWAPAVRDQFARYFNPPAEEIVA